MQILSRHQLLQLSDSELRATAECHGLDVEGLADRQLVDEFDDYLDGFRTLEGN